MNKTVLDLFCGAGGLSLGFQQAGFKVIGGVDFDSDAIKTHELNFKDTKAIHGDIRDITNKEIVDNFGSSVDVIIGGPPCQGFSTANMWQKDELKDERNRLFYEFIRFVKLLRPKVFVIENVRGILTKDNGYAKKRIYELMNEAGYNVYSSTLTSSDYGVPQKRVRAFFLGIDKNITNKFDFSKIVKKEMVNVGDALSDLYQNEGQDEENKYYSKPLSKYQEYLRYKCSVLTCHEIKYPNEKVIERMKHVKQGENWKSVPEKLWDTVRNNRHSSAYRRLAEDAPSVTIDTGHMNYFHPIFNRVPTVRESARIQSFPDNFVFTGTRGSQFRQVGNAVPPLLGKAIATEIINMLEEINEDN